MAKEKISTLIVLTMAVPGLSLAAENSEAPATAALDEVVVTAARVSESVREVSAGVMVIGPEEIAASPARDVGELLTQKGLGAVTRYPGELTSLNIRGFRTAPYGNDLKAHVLVLLNGRRAGTGNLAKIMTSNVERIEVIRGPGAVQYGSAAMGGVINVITRQGEGSPSAELSGKIGSYGYDENGVLVGGEQQGFDFSGSFSRATMDDYDTGSGDRFHNTGYDHIDHYSLNAGYNFLDRHRMGVIFTRYYGDEIGSPGYLTTNDLDDSKDSANHSMDLIYDGASLDKVYSWQMRYFTGKDQDTWFFPGTNGALDSTWLNKTDMSGAQAQGSMELGTVRLTAGVDWLDYESTSSADPAETDSENQAAFLLARAKFMEQRLIVDGGLRYDAYDLEVVEPAGRNEDDSNMAASAGAVYLLTDALKLRAHYGEAFIMPGADELAADFYVDYGFGPDHYVGNAALDPESSRTYEGGINYAQNGLSTGLGYFYTRYRDKIEVVASGPNEKTWENVGKAEISGFEGELSCDLGARLGWSFEIRPYVNLTYLDRFEDLDNDEDLKYVSDWNAAYGIYASDYQGFSARLNFAYTGEQTINDWSDFSTPVKSYGGFTVADLSISKKILDFKENGSFTLSGEVTNLFDNDYAYVKGYPMPGRMLFVSLTYKY